LEVSRARLNGLPAALARRVVREALRQCAGHLRGVDRGHVEAVLDLAAGAGGEKRLDLPGDLGVRAAYGRLVFDGGAPQGDHVPWSRLLQVPGVTPLVECGLEAVASLGRGPEALDGDGPGWPDPGHTVLLDAERAVAAGLVLRSCRPGDRYRPAGSPGSRKVARMLIDDRVPRSRRLLVPLLAAGEEPVWLPGHRPAEQWGWRPGRGRPCLRLELKPVAGDGTER
jgi:tRNA(Ile)-lysidine synthase